VSTKNLTLTAKIKLDLSSLSEVERRLGSLNSKVASTIDKKISGLRNATTSTFKSRQSAVSLKQQTPEKSDETLVLNKQMAASIGRLSTSINRFSTKVEKVSPKNKKYPEDGESSDKPSKSKNKKSGDKDGDEKRGKSVSTTLNRDLFHSINSLSSGGLPIGALSRAGLIGLAAFATYKAVEGGLNASRTDFDLYSREANTGVSANAIKYSKQGLAPGVGDQLFATFQQSQRFADFNRFAESNRLSAGVSTLVTFKNAGYIQKILESGKSGVDFQQDVINQTLQRYQSGAFGKTGSAYAKNQANAILQSTFGGDFSSVIQSYSDKKGNKTKEFLENITNDQFSKGKADLISPDNAQSVALTAANINLHASNLFHDSVNGIINIIKNPPKGSLAAQSGFLGFNTQGNV
jgi:hypothetical protein